MNSQDGERLARALLLELLTVDPRSWRVRQVLQITPFSPESYRARTSQQFFLGRDLVADVWGKIFADSEQSPPSTLDEIDVILPLEIMAKYVLLEFSLEDQAGKPLSLLTSSQTSPLSFEVVKKALTTIDALCEDGLDRAGRLIERFEPLLFALVASGQGEIVARLKRLFESSRNEPDSVLFHAAMFHFCQEGLQQFTRQPRLNDALSDAVSSGIRESYRIAMEMTPEQRGILGAGDGFCEPLLNPVALIVDYLKADNPRGTEEVQRRLPQFFATCHGLLHDLRELTADDLRFWPVTGLLSTMSRYYVAYTRAKVPIDRDFIVKMDQLIPVFTESSWRQRVRHPVRGWRERRFQWYPFGIGGSRSNHIEVSCEHPIELEQIPRKARVRADTWDGTSRRISAAEFFGRGSYETRYHQHFYTNKSEEEIQASLEARGVPALPRARLWLGIEYAVELSTGLGHSLILLIVAAAAVFLVKVYEPAALQVGQAQFLSIVPVLLGLFGALASLRPQEKIAARRLRGRRFAVLGLGFFMAVYFLFGLVCPEWFAVLWSLLG